MEVKCKKCHNQQHFNVEISDFKGYVCPACHSYFKGESLDELVFVKIFEEPKFFQWAKLGEIINISDKSFTIITKIQRLDKQGELSNEYVGLSTDDTELYLSDGSDFTCRLRPISVSALDINKSIVKCRGRKYSLVYDTKQKVLYAEGFVFEDLEKISLASTYEQQIDDRNFISYETFDTAIECYEGVYLDNETYFNLFSAYIQKKNLLKDASQKFNKLIIVAFIFLGLIYYMLNFGLFGYQKFSFYENFVVNSSTNQFVSKSFVLDGSRSKKLLLETISEIDTSNVDLNISLVNELTNEVRASENFKHIFNDVNHASAITVDFCKVEPGNYHLTFNVVGDIASISSIKVNEDYKLTYGGVSYSPLIFCCILLIILYLHIKSKLNEKKGLILSIHESISYYDLLKFQKFGVVYFAILLGLVAYEFNKQYDIGGCKTVTKVSSLEDNTYTGSRSHYYRRTSSVFSGSHK